jgi:hypothetical protein
MNDKAAVKKVKAMYSDIYKATSIDVEQIGKVTLTNLLSICDSTKHMEKRIEFYDNKECPDRNNWIDVEGEGYGWIWLKEQDDESKWHGLLKELLLEFIKNKTANLGNKIEYVVVVKIDDKTIFHFVERELSMCDTIYTFSDIELVY